MDIGTGKDLNEYFVDGKRIPYHLIDLAEPDKQFFLHEFQQHLLTVFTDITKRHKLPVICGGTGLYLDALRKDFSLTQVPENSTLRKELGSKSKLELSQLLANYPSEITKHVDLSSSKRIIRGIEIADYLGHNKINSDKAELPYQPFYIGISGSKNDTEKKILARLDHRLNNGLLEEVKALLKNGLTHDRLQYLGLEYKFISDHIRGNLSFEELRSTLGTAIRQYAKRQMTWYRKMEKEGVLIHWVDPAKDRDKIFEELEQFFGSL